MKLKNYGYNRGMTYTELIVVLGIFSVMSTAVIFNYGEFQAKVDIKNLANEVALRVVEAQKAAIFGKFPASPEQQAQITPGWKPAYGLYLNPASDNKSFLYFVDLNDSATFDGSDCSGECAEKISIAKGNYISSLDVFYQDASVQNLSSLALSFKRPDTTALFSGSPALGSGIAYVQITLSSPKAARATIKLYASGRVQIN